jgi:thymidylate synthase (FAD)
MTVLTATDRSGTDHDITFRSDIDVTLMDSMASDASVIAAARVSTQGTESEQFWGMDPAESAGLIKFLARNRHGCYDDHTEVLTRSGWKFWPDVDGTEEFLTLDMHTDEMEYQRAERLVRRPSDGPMIRLQMSQVDALVTPDHRMVAAPRTRAGWEYGLHPAKDMLERSHRLRLGGGLWDGDIHAPEDAALAGFIAADAHVGSSIEFSLHKDRKIDWLLSHSYVVSQKVNGRFYLLGPSEQLMRWAKSTYTETGDRCLPRELLERGDAETVAALLDGYLTGDGNVSPTGKITATTVSRQMVDDIQELALKVGVAAVETSPDETRAGAFGTRPVYRLTIYRERNLEPRIGWTDEARSEQVQVVNYTGDVHCVTVPNGTLYVRRNGKPMWCGNTPFEHNSFVFRVSAPIFVYREWHRHRVGWSYNEESGRYKALEPCFYLPGTDRKLIEKPGSKAGNYEYVPGTADQHDWLVQDMMEDCVQLYTRYQDRLWRGYAKEVARMTLPVNIYSSMYATCNARSLMAFLSLRTERDDATFPSKPMREIAMASEEMERIFAETMPITWAAFEEFGRVGP